MSVQSPDHECTVLGMGLRAQAQSADLQSLWMRAQSALPSLENFCAVAVLEGKEQRPALVDWMADLPFNAALIAVPQNALPQQAVITQSARLMERYGTGSVSEAVALSAAGPSPELLLPRMVADDGSATLAAALRHRPAGIEVYCCLAQSHRADAAKESQGDTA